MRWTFLPALRDQDEQLGDHGCVFSKALVRSWRRSENSRSIPPDRPIITWSQPPCPPMGRISRATARKRRFMRLRTTAPPIFFVMVKPTRMAGSASFRSRTSRMKPGVDARFPAFAARKSARFVMVARR